MMQFVIEIDDNLAKELIAKNSQEQLNGIFNEFVKKYLTSHQNEIILREGDDEVYGMWADRDMDVESYVRELRKGRNFNVD